ncbi:zeta toxin family protein [Acinetobacter sp.]|uniref:zeta toxin family protein n=1 Tax=Acinetobacter sp. TaxID=472 RepID=UPI0038910A92
MITFKEYMSESINDKGILKALFVVGIPGAGKSYTISELKGPISPKVVNSDISTEFLSKKLGVPANSENWKLIFRNKTKSMTRGLLTNYLDSMLPLFVDGTSNDASNILGRAGILESLGYDVGMVFVDTDLGVAIERAKARGEAIDRHVDVDFIEKVHELSVQNKEYFKGKFSFFREVWNNPGELDDKAILKIYRDVAGFYSEPLDNPVGIRFLEHLREEKQSYLVPTVMPREDLKKKVDGWFRA